MGFYGNITDMSRTHFQFDKIFHSRTEMDNSLAMGADNVFAGRFVLVKYDFDSPYFQGDILYGFKNENDNNDTALYADNITYQHPYVFTTFTKVNNPNINDCEDYYYKTERFYFKLPDSSYYSQEDEDNYYTPDVLNNDNIVCLNKILRLKKSNGELTNTFYQCIGGIPNDINVQTHSGQTAVWVEIIHDESYSNYFTNFQLDLATYKDDFDSRGYDGTVWQKVYSEGQGKFIPIARLNGSVPAFELFPSAPSLFPSSPYIDAKSTDDFYRIHVPSSWGFRIKKAQGATENLSDQQIIQKSYTITDGQITGTVDEEIPAEIYFNKNGFIKVKRNYDSENDNEILITPSGQSGKVYYNENGDEVLIDTYELAVHLPVIGNLISDFYDLMYGYYVVEDENSDPNNPTYSQLRFVDTDWIDGIHTAEEKYYGLSGKKTHDLNTVAGTLNTLHDRLGQIVCHLEEIPAQSQINNLSFNCIYEANNAFYRRGIKYRKITLGDDIYLVDRNAGEHFQNDTYYLYGGTDDYGNPIYTIANNYSADNTYYYKTAWCTYDEDLDAEHHFTTNKYYVSNGNNQYVPCQDTVYNPNQSYYLKNINRSRYTEIELTRYYPGEFYFLDGENYICDYHEPDPSDSQRTYYIITSPTSKTFTAGYESEKYYKLDEETGIYIRDDSLVPDPLDNRPYYDLNNTSYITTPQPCIFYAPNQFYYEEKDNLGTYYLATWETIDSTAFERYNFYAIMFSDVPQYGKNSDGEIVQYYEQIGDPILINNVLVIPGNTVYYYKTPDGKKYVPYDKLYTIFKNPYTVAREYISFSGIPQQYPVSSLYLPGRYHIKENNNYYKANGEHERNRVYYLLTSENISIVKNPFYIQNKYYIKINDNPEVFDRADTEYMDENETYYTGTDFFVDHDDTNECPYGYKWSGLAAYIPPSVTLYAREEYPALIPMDTAYNGNPDSMTINSALLYLHQSYDPLNVEIRDTSTFRGTLNSIKDLLFQIQRLEPGKICYVNSFGQITSSDISYDQLKNLLT